MAGNKLWVLAEGKGSLGKRDGPLCSWGLAAMSLLWVAFPVACLPECFLCSFARCLQWWEGAEI